MTCASHHEGTYDNNRHRMEKLIFSPIGVPKVSRVFPSHVQKETNDRYYQWKKATSNNKAQREPAQRTMIGCPSPMQNHHRFFLANLCVQARRLHSDETFRPFWLPFAFSDDWVCQTLRFFMIWEISGNGNLKKSQAVWPCSGFPEMPF